MLLELFQLGEKIVILVPMIVLCYVVLKWIFAIRINNYSFGMSIKRILCLIISVGLFFSMLVFSMSSILLIGNMWEDYESGEGNASNATVVEPYIKEASYFAATTFIMFTGSVVIFLCWQNICFRQIIPGKGSVINRIKALFREFKNES